MAPTSFSKTPFQPKAASSSGLVRRVGEAACDLLPASVCSLSTEGDDLIDQETVSRILAELLDNQEDLFDSEDEDVSSTNDYSSINEQVPSADPVSACTPSGGRGGGLSLWWRICTIPSKDDTVVFEHTTRCFAPDNGEENSKSPF